MTFPLNRFSDYKYRIFDLYFIQNVTGNNISVRQNISLIWHPKFKGNVLASK